MKHNLPLSLRILARLLLGFTLLLSLTGLVGSFALVAYAAPASNSSVTTCDESHLDQAIASAISGDTITFGCSGDIALTQTLTISKNLTLDGSGQNVILDGQNMVQVLSVDGGVTFTLNSLTVAHGSAQFSSGLASKAGSTVSINNSTFADNVASANGGAIINDGALTITNSTFANNSGQAGGAVGDDGLLTITNSTFANNSAQAGGGLYINEGKVTINNSIVANNSGGDCAQYGTLTDQGYNLSSDSSCGFTASTSQQNTDPKLDPNGLQSNGGPTQTIALQKGSPAIDQIPVASCPTSDQRGTARPDESEKTCDIGAYESTYPSDNDLGLTNMPANITTNATSQQGAVVTYTPPTVVDEDSPLPPVNCTPASGSTFAIGTTTVTCTVSDSDDINSPVSQSFTVTVQPALSVSISTITATEGSSFSGVVATGTAYGTTNPLSASIAWGDGNTSAGSVTLNSDGSYSVTGSYTYAEEGSYPVSVTVKDSGSLNATGNGTANVGDAPLTLTHFVAGPLSHHSAGVAATFTDADPSGQISDYIASINWGDGSTSTVKVYKNPVGKGFALAGLHSYASAGTYTVTLTVTDQGGSSVNQSAIITVK